jgi:hypothetical protein
VYQFITQRYTEFKKEFHREKETEWKKITASLMHFLFRAFRETFLDTGYRILDTGYWMLDTGHWVWGIGRWKNDAGSVAKGIPGSCRCRH